jgi:nucleotide-binding universal stress UspA family protein
LADLVVVSRPGSDADAAASTILEAALFDTGQPLMLAPPRSVGEVGSNILIGWNGSPESARAVSAAIPFLREAKGVTILSASGWFEGMLSVEALANRLAWHGVQADVTTIADPGDPVGEIVLSEVANRNVDLLVMGAYTQSRLRQMILGGVTRHVLGNSMVPVIMAH